MKTITQCLAALCCCITAHAAQQIVVPGGLVNVEGNSSSADLFNTTGGIFQQVYSASEFAFLGAPTGRIDAVSFRLDGETGQRFAGAWPSISIILSTTIRSPDSLSPRFGDNAGPDAVEVFGGPKGIVAQDNSPGVRPFEVRIPFETPFFYDLSRGNLSMIISAGLGPANLVLDAQLATGDSVGRVFGDGLVGTVDSLGLISRFDITPIPEPRSVVLALTAMLLTLVYVRYRHYSLLRDGRQ